MRSKHPAAVAFEEWVVEFPPMVEIPTATMNSLEISKLVKSRHDKVKRTIERLAERQLFVLPPLGDVPFVDDSGRNRTTSAYIFSGEQGKRDSIIERPVNRGVITLPQWGIVGESMT